MLPPDVCPPCYTRASAASTLARGRSVLRGNQPRNIPRTSREGVVKEEGAWPLDWSPSISMLMVFRGSVHGSPHAFDELRILLCAALRPDIAPLKIKRASPVIRTVPPDEPLPHPETCVPYREATGMGFVLRPSLPLLFVRNRGGELLPDAATALAYAREHAADFKGELDVIADFASSVLEPAVVGRYERRAPLLFRDLAQPYSLFGPTYYSIPAGLYVQTEPGIGTVIWASTQPGRKAASRDRPDSN